MNTDAVDAVRRPRYGRWRAATLAGVYLLMAAHVIHWQIAGKTLAPLELNEVMYTLELGIVTAGFLFMALALVATLIFGRFFCSWGCHILALEDLCAWILAKVGIRPKPIRSRLLLAVPPLALFYMFVWPQITRIVAGEPRPVARVLGDADGWASFATNDFWRNLPGPWIALITFAICGFAIVYVLGSRAFCTYGCPYGALFALADRAAPGRIVANGDCTECGRCTAACQSHIRIHEEVRAHGMIVNPACLKDLDCVAACPDGALRFGFRKPAGFKSWTRFARRKIRYDFSLAEEILMGATFLVTLLVFRGLYATVPFLLTLGLGGIFGYIAVTSLRLLRRHSPVRFCRLALLRKNRLTKSGFGFAVAAALVFVFIAHSAFIRYHEHFGHAFYTRANAAALAGGPGASEEDIERGIEHLTLCDRYGLMRPRELLRRLAHLHQHSGNEQAESYFRRMIARDPSDAQARFELARLCDAIGRPEDTREQLETIVNEPPQSRYLRRRTRQTEILVRAAAHSALAPIVWAEGDADGAERHLRMAEELRGLEAAE